MRRFSAFLLTAALASLMLAGLAACDLINGQEGPKLEFTSQVFPKGKVVVVNGDSVKYEGGTMTVNGDTVTFHPIDPGTAPENPYSLIGAEVVQGKIHINGFFFAPSWGQPLKGEIARSEDTIELRIWPGADRLPDVPQPYRYEAWITGLSAGTYQLQIVHEGDAMLGAGRDVVLDKQVRVK